MKEHSHTSKLFQLARQIRYRLILEGALIGAAAGAVVALYRWILVYAEKFSQTMYLAAKGHILLICAVFAGLLLLGILCGLLIQSEPMIKGSGIPQVEGTILGYFRPSWLKVLLKKFVGGILAIGAGLSLGREGPSIQLGASVGQGFASIFHRIRFEEKYLITCGASAGLAAAFNAPLAGVLFSIEEVHKNFSPNILLSAMASAITADFVSKNIFGMNSVFDTIPLDPLTFKYYPVLIALAICLGLFGAFYNKTLLKTQDLYAKLPLPEYLKPVIPFILAGILGMTIPAVLGGGHGIINGIIQNQYLIRYMILLLAIKFLFSMVSFGSGTAGGIFFPLLVLGALAGGIFGKISVLYLGLPQEYVVTFMLLGMVGMFTSIVRAPVTGIILIIEMSGSLTHLLSLTLIAVISYVVAEAVRSKPIYESLLERMIGKDDEQIEDDDENLLLQFVVGQISRIEGRRIKDIDFPKGCLIVSIARVGGEILPDGDTIIKSGDILTVLCSTKEESDVRESMDYLVSRKI